VARFPLLGGYRATWRTQVEADLKEHMLLTFGAERQRRYWEIFEQLRQELGYADYLGALQRYRAENQRDTHLVTTSFYLLNYPFAQHLYPGALSAIAHLETWGPAVILSDGDVVFQPHKIERSGIWRAVGGKVLIYIHKEQMLDDVEARYPAQHYVMVDDKLRILSAMKQSWGERLTTIFPRQGHYAHDPQALAAYPAAGIALERIGDLMAFALPTLLGAAKPKAPQQAEQQ
jgi:FMN phosphatase YigB (HAD superfamily)